MKTQTIFMEKKKSKMHAGSGPHIGHGGADDHSRKYHILTYEDDDSDWMMAGDVPWEYV